ncbi:MAG TPA: nitroreductase family protein [Acidimicrobiales bacterium]|nr:nitroreductase family protein [Acidimicrobiales bacterium]
MTLDLTPDELLTTTRSVRKRLDLTRPVEREVVARCIEIALQAPTGSNRQGFHFMVVDDAEKRAGLAALYAKSWEQYAAAGSNTWPEGDPRHERYDAVKSSAAYLAHHLHEVPVHVIPCAPGRLGSTRSGSPVSFFASVIPAAWSFMLAARARGLGTVLTSLHLAYEREAAELLGIPHDDFTQVGLIPVAYSIGTDFKPAARVPVEAVTHWNEW